MFLTGLMHASPDDGGMRLLALTLLCWSLATSAEPQFRDVRLADDVILRFAWIPGGRHAVGDVTGSGQRDEQPTRQVELDGFWLMTHEFTRKAFGWYVRVAAVVLPSGCQVYRDDWAWDENASWNSPGHEQSDAEPVVCLSWHEVQAMVEWLRARGIRVRLPSEAEWEAAARGGTTSTWFWGEDRLGLCRHANSADKTLAPHHPSFSIVACDDGHYRTAPVASFEPNAFGLHDVYGNVWEWVQDCWNESYVGAPADGSAWLEGDCERRGFRGGGWGDIPAYARSAIRNRTAALNRKDDVGFRLVLEPD
ncbi:MAG: SUMF1/EgtB/PvdO family nonheme iron enzyme [Pseudomonadota bacterium]